MKKLFQKLFGTSATDNPFSVRFSKEAQRVLNTPEKQRQAITIPGTDITFAMAAGQIAIRGAQVPPDNCSRHPKQVAGIADMEVLANLIGDLHYETLTELLSLLSKKIEDDAISDYAGGRKKLSAALHKAAEGLFNSAISMQRAWFISLPFMSEKPSGEIL
jgi:hypothetical protein